MVIGSAQDLANSGRAWSEAVEIAESDEELAFIEKITREYWRDVGSRLGAPLVAELAGRRT
jgi:hypothetical protein